MDTIERKLADFPSRRFLVISQCNDCGSKQTVNQELYADATLNSIQHDLFCQECGGRNLNVSIVLNKKAITSQSVKTQKTTSLLAKSLTRLVS